MFQRWLTCGGYKSGIPIRGWAWNGRGLGRGRTKGEVGEAAADRESRKETLKETKPAGGGGSGRLRFDNRQREEEIAGL